MHGYIAKQILIKIKIACFESYLLKIKFTLILCIYTHTIYIYVYVHVLCVYTNISTYIPIYRHPKHTYIHIHLLSEISNLPIRSVQIMIFFRNIIYRNWQSCLNFCINVSFLFPPLNYLFLCLFTQQKFIDHHFCTSRVLDTMSNRNQGI